MNARRLWYSAALLLLAPALTALAADKDAFGDPLPEGAKARLGTARGGPVNFYGGASLLPPKYDTFLVPDQKGLHLHEAATGKVTEVVANDRLDMRTIVAVSADGKRAIADRYGTYGVLEVTTGKTLQTIRAQGGLGYRSAVSVSADGKLFAHDSRARAGGAEAKMEAVVWDLDKNAEVVRVTALQNQSLSTVLSPDGKYLATFGQHYTSGGKPTPEDGVRPERVVQVWEVATGKQLAALNDTTRDYGVVFAAAFSPDGKTLATASGGGSVALWEVPAGKLKDALLGRSTQGMRLAFAPDGKTLAAADQFGAVERWSLPDGKPLKLTECPVAATRVPSRYQRSPVQVSGLAFADNERAVVWGSLWGRAIAWEAPGGKLLTPVSNHFAEVQAVQFAANGRDVVTAGRDGRVVRWDVASGKAAVVTTAQDDDVGPSTDYRWALAPGGKRGLRGPLVFDLETGAEAFRLPAAYAFPSPDFTHALAVASTRDRKAATTTCTVWNLDTRKKVSGLELPVVIDSFRARGDLAVAFSPDNTRLITTLAARGVGPDARDAFVVTGWEVKTGKKLGELSEPNNLQLTEVAAANNNSGAVLATYDGKLWVADYEKGVRADTVEEAARGTLVRCPTFSPDGKLFAVGVPAEKAGEFAVRVYSWPQGKALHTFAGHKGQVTSLAFSPDGKTLASGSYDTTVLLWDLTAIEKK